MNKFQKSMGISNKEIRGIRAEIVTEDANIAVENILRREKEALRALKKRELSLTDIYPDSEFSTMVTKANFEATEWVEKLLKVKVDIAVQKVKVDAAQAIVDEWFTDDEVETKKD